MFLLFLMVFPLMTCFRLLFLRKGIIRSIEKVLSRALLDLICFKLLGCAQLYDITSGKVWASRVAFGFSSFFLSENVIFLTSFSVEHES